MHKNCWKLSNENARLRIAAAEFQRFFDQISVHLTVSKKRFIKTGKLPTILWNDWPNGRQNRFAKLTSSLSSDFIAETRFLDGRPLLARLIVKRFRSSSESDVAQVIPETRAQVEAFNGVHRSDRTTTSNARRANTANEPNASAWNSPNPLCKICAVESAVQIHTNDNDQLEIQLVVSLLRSLIEILYRDLPEQLGLLSPSVHHPLERFSFASSFISLISFFGSLCDFQPCKLCMSGHAHKSPQRVQCCPSLEPNRSNPPFPGSIAFWS